MKTNLKNFVLFPREILQDLRNGFITLNEFNIYCYIRLSGNPYGIAVVSLENIKNDIFRGQVSTNYCNKLLLSLKRKRYIYYQGRKGRRGSFEVHLGDWALPNKEIKRLDMFFSRTKVRGEGGKEDSNQSEVSQNFNPLSQNFKEQKTQLIKHFSLNSNNGIVRGSNNDTDNENNIYKIDISNFKESFNKSRSSTFKEIPVEGFIPKSYEEQKCLEIAKKLGEKDIRFLLSCLREYGIHRIKSAWGIYKEIPQDQKNKIQNPAAYFNKLISELNK